MLPKFYAPFFLFVIDIFIDLRIWKKLVCAMIRVCTYLIILENQGQKNNLGSLQIYTLSEGDPAHPKFSETARRYFYSIKDISIGNMK